MTKQAEQRTSEILAKLAIIKSIIDVRLKNSALEDLIAEARALGIPINIIQELESKIDLGEQTEKLSTAYGDRQIHDVEYSVGNTLEAICDNFPEHVSERAKQNYITSGTYFFNTTVDKNGETIAELQILNSLVDKDRNKLVSKKEIEALNNFIKEPKESGQILEAAKRFNDACKDVAQEIRQDKKWQDLDDKAKSSLEAVESTRIQAGKLLVAEKKVDVMADIKKIAIKLEKIENPSESIAFNILREIRGNNQTDISTSSSLAKLEALDKEISNKSLRSIR